jgi:hypothetical protein
MLQINGTDIPTPSEFIWGESDIDSTKSGRAADGKMHRDRIGSKIKLTLKWSFLTNKEMASLLKAVTPVFFNCAYPDAEAGTTLTKSFYVSDRTAPAYAVQDGKCGWSGLEMSFVEQ